MELRIKLNEKDLDAVQVFASSQADSAYILWLKKSLLKKHKALITRLNTEPLFYLVGSEDGKQSTDINSYQMIGYV
jgi:hypothetical protein